MSTDHWVNNIRATDVLNNENDWKQTAAKKERGHFEQFEYTLNSAHHVKKQCNFVSS